MRHVNRSLRVNAAFIALVTGVTTGNSVIDSWRSRPPASHAWQCCSCTQYGWLQ